MTWLIFAHSMATIMPHSNKLILMLILAMPVLEIDAEKLLCSEDPGEPSPDLTTLVLIAALSKSIKDDEQDQKPVPREVDSSDQE